MSDQPAVQRYRRIFRLAHAGHPSCLEDEWLMRPCHLADGREVDRSLVWSRRNGPWRRVDLLWVGAAPGNAGGMGSGSMGAHGTRIPFGGDIAGANLDVLLGSVGLDRNDVYIVAALNQLPDAGGGEPRVAELRRPVGDFPTSLHLLRETVLAAGPGLVVALGNVALRTTIAAARLDLGGRVTLPGLKRLEAAGLARGESSCWPEDFPPDPAFVEGWRSAWGNAPLPSLLWLLHPSAQNMSPYAAADTVFHQRMLETRTALRRGVRDVLGIEPPERRTEPGKEGIYALPEWRESIGPRHRDLMRRWREKGV